MKLPLTKPKPWEPFADCFIGLVGKYIGTGWVRVGRVVLSWGTP